MINSSTTSFAGGPEIEVSLNGAEDGGGGEGGKPENTVDCIMHEVEGQSDGKRETGTTEGESGSG